LGQGVGFFLVAKTSEAERLVELVGLAVVGRGVWRAVDAFDDAAGGVARDDVGVDAPLEVVRRGAGADLDAVELLAELGIGFAACHLRDARARHEVAFVGRVHEHLAADAVAVLEDQLRQAIALFLDLREAVFEEYRDIKVGQHRQEQRLYLGRALDLLFEEIEEDRLRHAADGVLLAIVDVAEAGRRHPAHVAAEDEDSRRSCPSSSLGRPPKPPPGWSRRSPHRTHRPSARRVSAADNSSAVRDWASSAWAVPWRRGRPQRRASGRGGI